MIVKVLSCIAVTVAVFVIQAEGRGPYAPSGWQLKIPFNLPNDYLPPNSRRSSNTITSVEISRARVVPLNIPNSNYGPPTLVDVPTTKQNSNGSDGDDNFTIIYPDEEETSTSSSDNIKEGRYFIISPEKKLQRIVYRTQQNENDGNEDFTAQLKYSIVGELHDPVYRSTNQGQLERVLK